MTFEYWFNHETTLAGRHKALAELAYDAGYKAGMGRAATECMGEEWSSECNCCEGYVCTPCTIRKEIEK